MPFVQKKTYKPYIAILRFAGSIVLWVGGVILLVKALGIEGSSDKIKVAGFGFVSVVDAFLLWLL